MGGFKIENYSVVILSDRAQIILYEDVQISQTTRRVVLRLNDQPDTQVNDQGTTTWAEMGVSMLGHLVDLLRNEDPVNVVWWPNLVYVYAGPEPVGEGELEPPN